MSIVFSSLGLGSFTKNINLKAHMKFGICLPIRITASALTNVDIAKKAESLGFDSVWVSDHVVMPLKHQGRFSDVFYDPFILLSHIAGQTGKITLGTSVIILPYRNPIVVAKMISTLDMLSEGRVVFGVGAGWMKEEYEALNVEYSHRGARTNEYIEAIKKLWVDDNPDHSGDYCSFSNIKFEPKPYQKPHPPVWVAGSSTYAIKRAAVHGDGWQPTWVSPEDVGAGIHKIRDIAAQNGRSLEDFVYSARNRVKIKSNGYSENNGDSPYTLRGDAESIAEQIRQYQICGVSHFVVDPDVEDTEEIYQLIETFSDEIMPELKG